MKKDYLYIIQSDVTGQIKIGRSIDPDRRLKQLQTANARSKQKDKAKTSNRIY